MKCNECGMMLTPDEEDQILQAVAEGISPSKILCDDCIDSIYYDDMDDYDDDEF